MELECLSCGEVRPFWFPAIGNLHYYGVCWECKEKARAAGLENMAKALENLASKIEPDEL